MTERSEAFHLQAFIGGVQWMAAFMAPMAPEGEVWLYSWPGSPLNHRNVLVFRAGARVGEPLTASRGPISFIQPKGA